MQAPLEESITAITASERAAEQPLRSEEQEVADRLAGRLHSELRAVLRTMPSTTRTASGLARYLELERTGCQRMMSALSTERPDAQVLTRLPGIATLQTILQRAEAKGAPDETVASARTAVELLAEYFDRAGGGQSVFARRLLITSTRAPDPGAAAGSESTAQTLFETARSTIGRWSALQVQIAIYRPDPTSTDSMQTARMRGFIGHQATPQAPPLVLLSRKTTVTGEPTSTSEYEALDSTQTGNGPMYAATPFCSDSAIRVANRRGGGVMAQIVDAPEPHERNGFDFVTADRSIHSVPMPTIEDPPIHELWVSPDYPAARLLFDVWQHRDMARCCIPSLSTHLYRINVMETPGDRWYTRLAGGPKLELLGTGIEHAASAFWPRHSEALQWMFERLGWNPNDFVGYRCEVLYPLWRIGYLMALDFSGSAPAPTE